MDKYKARLVAQGFTQCPGVDYTDTFAPVVNSTSLKVFFAVSNQLGLDIQQMDVKTAFLNGNLDEEIYLRQPKGYEVPGAESKVYHLKKAIYGLKQASREWNKSIESTLTKLGLTQSVADQCVYLKRRNSMLTMVAVYVDDILIASNDKTTMNSIKIGLKNAYDIHDLGSVHGCLGIEVIRPKDGELVLRQGSYIRDTVEHFQMESAKPVFTPGSPSYTKVEPQTEGDNSFEFRTAIGKFTYAMVHTRPDISVITNILSQRQIQPKSEDIKAAKHVLKYLNTTARYGLVYRRGKAEDFVLQGFVDSDWANNPVDRKSMTGYAFYLGDALISWKSRKQRTTALSSTEAEYMALTDAVKEAIWLRKLLGEIGIGVSAKPTTIFEDNTGCIALAKNPEHHQRTKHIDVRYHMVREQVDKFKTIHLEYVPTSDQVADVFTKVLPRVGFEKCRQKLGLEEVKVETK